jgi:hypothetical protein
VQAKVTAVEADHATLRQAGTLQTMTCKPSEMTQQSERYRFISYRGCLGRMSSNHRAVTHILRHKRPTFGEVGKAAERRAGDLARPTTRQRGRKQQQPSA